MRVIVLSKTKAEGASLARGSRVSMRDTYVLTPRMNQENLWNMPLGKIKVSNSILGSPKYSKWVQTVLHIQGKYLERMEV